MKVYPVSRVLTFLLFLFSQYFHVRLRQQIQQPIKDQEIQTTIKIRNLSYHLGDEKRKKLIEMTIKQVELCISISPHFKAFHNLFSFV